MAEWSNAAVLKTVDLHGSGGSNPSSSAKYGSLNAALVFTPEEGFGKPHFILLRKSASFVSYFLFNVVGFSVFDYQTLLGTGYSGYGVGLA